LRLATEFLMLSLKLTFVHVCRHETNVRDLTVGTRAQVYI